MIIFTAPNVRPTEENMPGCVSEIDGAPAPAMFAREFSRHGGLMSGTWACGKGRFLWRYAIDEIIYIIEGEALIRDTVDPLRAWYNVGAGSSVHFPQGCIAEWEVRVHVRKFWVLADIRGPLRRWISGLLR